MPVSMKLSIDDCSRKVASKCSERKRSIDVLDVLEEWIMINGKPKRIMHDNGKQFTSMMFKRFLEHNNIRDKPIPNSYPQLQIFYNKYIDEGKVRYDMFVKAYNDKREHGGINGLTPSEMFLQTFNTSRTRTNTKQEGVTYVGI
ncbi:MAG: DDE-type integrase/transposase/recombinase [Candidatus Nitrosopolaris sp.]